jgi:hypothetical protein
MDREDDFIDESTTVRATKRGVIGGHGCTFVVYHETLEASLIFENEPYAPLEFVVDDIELANDEHVSSDNHVFFRNLNYAVPKCTPVDVDFDTDERGQRITVTTAFTSVAWIVGSGRGAVVGPLRTLRFQYSGYLGL